MLNILHILGEIIIITLLSAWLNLLYLANKEELSFPHKYPCPWQWRSAKIIIYAGSLAYLLVKLFPYTTIGYGVLSTYTIVNSSIYPDGNTFFFVLYSSFLLTMMWSDIEQQIIMNHQLALFAILGLCFQLLTQPEQLPLQLITAAVGGLAFLLLAILTRGGIGGGDIKLIAALGLWLKPEAMECTALGGIILGGLLALGAIITKRKSRKDYIPYGPGFIIMALFAYFLY